MTFPNFRFRMTPRGVDSAYHQDGTFWVRGEKNCYYQLDQDYLLGEDPMGCISPAQFTADGVKELLARLEPTWHVSDVAEVTLPPGKYHPRAWRQMAGPPPAALYGRDFTSDIVNFDLLERELENLFQIIEPYKGSPHPSPNELTFGHGIRRLLILACTEVENLLKRVMLSNGYVEPLNNSGKPAWNTNHYVKTYPVLKLGNFTSRLVRYPDYPTLQPFHGWDQVPPSQGLDWYNAYNTVKHDRMEGLKEATFTRALNAVAAVHILLTAQYGIGLNYVYWGRFILKSEDYHSRVFVNEALPSHPVAAQYIPPFKGKEFWSPVALPGGFP